MSDSFLFQIARSLWNIVNDPDSIVWIGSGLSKDAGYPEWLETVNKLCSCGVPPLTSTAPTAEQLIDKAEECKVKDRSAYTKTLATLFGGLPVRTRQAYQLLMKLPFKGYVTTNHDPLLATAGAMHSVDNLFAYPDLPIRLLGGSSKSIFYIHGLARNGPVANGENLILARSDFELAYKGIVRSFLDQLLTYHPILFLGCSLREPAVQEAFRRVHQIQLQIDTARPGTNRPKRYTLMPIQKRKKRAPQGDAPIEERDFESEYDEEERLKALGISLIRYEPRSEQHAEIEEILEHLCDIAGLYARPTVRSGYIGGGTLS